ncbi:MAG: response regulator, partial [Schlesneria sp.]
MPGRVLIVEDDQSMCELIEADLACRDIQSEWRTSAAEALLVIQDGQFDVILTDLQMPGLN